MSPTTTWRRWWIAAGLLLVLALAPGSWQRQSQSEAGHITRESLAGLFPAASSTVTCAWPAEVKDRSPMPLRTHRGCRQLPDGDMEWITEC